MQTVFLSIMYRAVCMLHGVKFWRTLWIGAILGMSLIPFSGSLSAQELEESENLPVDRPQNFQLLLNRGFLIGSVEGDDRAPINGSLSGSLFLGFSFKAILPRQNAGVRITPGVNWFKINYRQEDEKVFPTDTVFESEKHVFTYLEVPVGFFINFSKDEDGDPRLFTELGGFLGYKLNGSYKRKFEEGGRTSRLIRRDVPNVEDWRFGLYGRLGFKRWALYYSYLLSDTFSAFTTEDGTTPPNDLSTPPTLEIGISFIL
ncbi:MAG: outer membrane beta-barrel protein [Bacteroidota bacterium]